MCPVTRFVRCGDYLEFWMGLKKILTKRCDQLHVFAVQTILSFWMGLRKVSTKICAQLHIFSLWRLTWVFDGTWNNFHEKVYPVICFFALETILSFWWDLENFSQKSVPSYTFCSLWRLSWVLDGTLKNFDKKVWPVTRFRSADYLKFLDGT